MSNKSKAKEIAQTRIEHLDEYDLCYEAAMKMAKYKDIELKNQEQSLLWTLYSILDGLAVEGEARDYAINEFKKHLEYYKED